jgi:hypothetical protein
MIYAPSFRPTVGGFYYRILRTVWADPERIRRELGTVGYVLTSARKPMDAQPAEQGRSAAVSLAIKKKVVLRGGPVGLPTSDRVIEVVNLPTSVKVPFYGGYERFEHRGEHCQVDGDTAAVFEWIYRTKVAE